MLCANSIRVINICYQDKGVVKSVAFQKKGTQGNLWKNANISLPVYNDLSLVFEGIVGPGFRGDIALDDISVTTGPCFGARCKLLHCWDFL